MTKQEFIDAYRNVIAEMVRRIARGNLTKPDMWQACVRVTAMEQWTPGRELDREVAERVMGWTDLEWTKQYHTSELSLQGVIPGTLAAPHTGYKTKHVVPKYSTEIAAAWEVVEKLQKFNPFWESDGFMEFDLSPTSGFDGHRGWQCNFGDDTTQAFADTAPHAICMAALASNGTREHGNAPLIQSLFA